MKIKETLAQLMLQVRSVMGKLTPTQRLSLGLLAGVVVVSFVILIIVNTSGSGGGGYVNLFYQPLDPERQAYVIQKLGTADYKIEDGIIKVRKNDRERLAAMFLQDRQVYQEKDWFASLFESNLMDTDALRDKKYLIAREKQLSAEISYFDQVKRANVNINPGDDTRYFNDDVRRATASVFIELKSGVNRLSQDTVNSIAGAVACSIKGLSPENISICDYSGKNYRPSMNKDNAPSDNERLEVTSKISDFLEEQIRKCLNYPGLGVAVFPNINWDKVEKTITTYPKIQEPTYTSRTVKTTGGSASPEGLVGVTSNVDNATGANVPQDTSSTPSSVGGEATSSSSEIDVTPFSTADQTIEHILKNPGEVDDRTVSVSVPYNILATPVNGRKTPEDPAEADKIVQENIKNIKEQIKRAVGISDDPKDDAKVYVAASRPVEVPEMKAAALSESFWEYSRPLIGKAAIAVFALISLLLVATFVRRNIPKPQQIPIEEIEEKIEKEVEKEKKDFLAEMEKLDDKELKVMQVKERVQEMIDENVESAANLLRSWIQKES
jgi:flagellar biosynthesis/type III secretory pathway M-ring protein FliF/YscJ